MNCLLPRLSTVAGDLAKQSLRSSEWENATLGDGPGELKVCGYILVYSEGNCLDKNLWLISDDLYNSVAINIFVCIYVYIHICNLYMNINLYIYFNI